MGEFREAWTSLLSWLPPPMRVAIAIIITALIVTKLAPRVIRGCGNLLHACWAPLLEILTYPEFLLTSLSRHYGRRPPPGTYSYGRTLGTLAATGTSLGQWLRNRFQAYPRFPRKTVIFIIAIIVACWYLTPKIPASEPKTVMSHMNNDVVRVDSWVATGRWKQAGTTSVSGCSPAKPATGKSARHKRHRKHKRRRAGFHSRHHRAG
jgi:hypothetical protein